MDLLSIDVFVVVADGNHSGHDYDHDLPRLARDYGGPQGGLAAPAGLRLRAGFRFHVTSDLGVKGTVLFGPETDLGLDLDHHLGQHLGELA